MGEVTAKGLAIGRRAVHDDGLNALPLVLGELLEEAIEGGFFTALASIEELALLGLRDQGDVTNPWRLPRFYLSTKRTLRSSQSGSRK